VLRLLIAALLVANLGYWAWRHGWLAPFVDAVPHGERDPARLDRQVDPQAVVFVPAGAASRAASAARDLPSCVEAGPFDASQVEAAEAALLAQVPAGNWTRVVTTEPGTWAVYMGRYLDAETLQRKQAELRRLRVSYETLRDSTEWAPGLVLSRYPTRDPAEAALQQFNQRGVRTARVIEIIATRSVYVLRSDGGDALLVEQLLGVRSPALGRGFSACAARGAGG
jgi:hypothetical protein